MTQKENERYYDDVFNNKLKSLRTGFTLIYPILIICLILFVIYLLSKKVFTVEKNVCNCATSVNKYL